MKNMKLDSKWQCKMKRKASVFRKISLLTDKMKEDVEIFIWMPALVILGVSLIVLYFNNSLYMKILYFILYPLLIYIALYWGFCIIFGTVCKKWFRNFNTRYIDYTLQKDREEMAQRKKRIGL